MIKSTFIEFTKDEIKTLDHKISECNDILQIRYPYRVTLLMIIFEFLLIFLVYVAETNDFQTLLLISVLLTIIPVWIVISSLILYFSKRIPFSRLNKKYSIYKKAGKYECMTIQSNVCERKSISNIDYYIFHIDQKTILLMRLQDFSVNNADFPNNRFLIPPRDLFEVIGTKIIIQGSKIERINDNSKLVMKYKKIFDLMEPGSKKILDIY